MAAPVGVGPRLLPLVLAGLLGATPGCTSVNLIGRIGPKELPVYSIKDNGFLTSTGMLVILNSQGEVAASVGGTVQGAGPLIGNAVTGLATAGAIGYGANVLSEAVRNINVRAGGSIGLRPECPTGVDCTVPKDLK